MKLLLGRGDVDPDKPDNTHQTPLSCATKEGNAGVVEILLRGAVSIPTNLMRTTNHPSGGLLAMATREL